MAQYIIYFNQQWVGDHPEEWFIPRGPLSRAVVAEMKEQNSGDPRSESPAVGPKRFESSKVRNFH